MGAIYVGKKIGPEGFEKEVVFRLSDQRDPTRLRTSRSPDVPSTREDDISLMAPGASISGGDDEDAEDVASAPAPTPGMLPTARTWLSASQPAAPNPAAEPVPAAPNRASGPMPVTASRAPESPQVAAAQPPAAGPSPAQALSPRWPVLAAGELVLREPSQGSHVKLSNAPASASCASSSAKASSPSCPRQATMRSPSSPTRPWVKTTLCSRFGNPPRVSMSTTV